VNLTSGDVQLNHSGTMGGSVAIVNGTTANPSVEITGVTGDGGYTITIVAGIAADAVGNTSKMTDPSDAVSVDNTAPSVSIGAPLGSPLNSTDSAAYPVTVTGAVSINLTSGDVTLRHYGTAGGDVVVYEGMSVNPAIVVRGVTGNGSYTISIEGGIATDAAGNSSEATGPSDAVTVDKTAPSVSIGAPTGWPLNSAGTATYPVMVSGADNINLTSDAVTLSHSGTAGGSVVVVDGTSETPTIEVSGVAGDGSYSISISAGIATDAAGNLSETTGPSDTVLVDNTAPAFTDLVANPSEASEGDTVSISFDSSEPISADPAVTVNGNPANRTTTAAFAYKYTLSSTDPLGPASIVIVGTDTVGNTGTLSNTTALTILEVAVEGEGDGSVEGEGEAAGDGEGEGVVEGTLEGDGDVEGDVEGSVEGASEGEEEGDVEGAAEGEGAPEGEGEGENPPVGCNGCNANGAPMQKSLGDWLAGFLGLAVLLGAYLRLQRQLHPGA